MDPESSPVGSLLEFCRLVRSRGLPIGTDDAMTYMTATATLDPAKLEDVYWAGRVTLVHSRNQIPIYDACFTEFFLGGAPGADEEPIHRHLSAKGAEAVFDVPSGEPPEDGDDQRETRLGAQASAVLVDRAKTFADASEEELRAMRRIIAALRASPPPRRTRRHRGTTSGQRLDLRRIARETMRTHGEPGNLWWRRRRQRPRPLVLILDISGSMADYSRNLLQFAHSTRRATGRVEVFCFGTRLTRITHSLRTRNPDEALEHAGAEAGDWAGGTQIGASLDEFVRRYARRGLARGAYVIICSDGLDRGSPSLLDDALERLGRLSYRIIWVNPMMATEAGAGPSSLGMSVAMPHIDILWSGHNLESLEAFAEALPGFR